MSTKLNRSFLYEQCCPDRHCSYPFYAHATTDYGIPLIDIVLLPSGETVHIYTRQRARTVFPPQLLIRWYFRHASSTHAHACLNYNMVLLITIMRRRSGLACVNLVSIDKFMHLKSILVPKIHLRDYFNS